MEQRIQALQDENEALMARYRDLENQFHVLQNDPQHRVVQQLREDEAARADRAHQNDLRINHDKIIDEIVRSISSCDGSSPSLVRQWISDIDVATLRIDNGPDILTIVSRTVRGSLRKEIERFIHEQITGIAQVRDRNQVQWAQ